MMELGATICTPKSPQCGKCPVKSWCRAHKLGIAEELPSARKKPATIDLTLAAAVLLDPRGRTLLVRQVGKDGALFSRMWQFPAIEMTGAETGTALAGYLHEKFGLTVGGHLAPLAAARHTVTFRNIRLEPYLIHVAQLPRVKGARTVMLGQIRRLPISNATRKIAAVAQDSAAEG
jgi:A/G-specific adenine glycosylase